MAPVGVGVLVRWEYKVVPPVFQKQFFRELTHRTRVKSIQTLNFASNSI